MERALAATLAAVAVLAIAVPGPAAVASPSANETTPAATSPVAMSNTTAKLVLPGGGRPGAGVAGADLGAAVATDRATLSSDLGAAVLERRFEAAATDEERARVVRRGFERIVNRTRELRAVEARAYRQFAAGNRSLRSLLLTLARVDARARAYRERIRRLADLAARVPGVSLREQGLLVGRASGTDKQLETLTGPVRRHVARTYRGGGDGGVVYVAAAEQGVVLAAMINGTYVREALRADRIEPGPGHPIALREFAQRTYPWTWDNRQVTTSFEGFPTIGVWRLVMGHSQGQLRAYIDRGTESVFREIQWLRPERLPNVRTTTAAGDGLAVRVNRTFPGGPLEVTVADNATGRPVGSVVTVGDHRLGRTGPDGELWTVAPRGPVTVTVTQGPNSVNVTVPESEF